MNLNLMKLATTFMFIIILAACGNQAEKAEKQSVHTEQSTSNHSDKQSDNLQQQVSVVDGTGQKITLEKPAKRIVEIRGSGLDMLAELGVKDVTTQIGYQELANYFFGKEKAKGFGKIRGSWIEPNIEDIIAAKPDLVIGGAYPHAELVNSLKGVAPVYLLTEKGHYMGAVRDLERLGVLTGKEKEAKQAINHFLTKLKEYKEKSPKNKSALVLMGSDTNFNVYTETSRTGSLLAEVTNYPKILKGGNPKQYEIPLSLEEILAINPDVLFMESLGNEPLSKQLSKNPVWSQLSAVKNNRVYEIDGKIWHSGRGTKGSSVILDHAMPLLYPEIFPKK
ncbi:MAG TPA: ABC transporter substrate-binding protein [Bacillales bacterium]|nr:ABC transporter substrate-binding protein [Bacillales bacterium]